MKTILIIEDQAPMRRNLSLMLELEGYRVITAADGKEGLEACRRHLPDLVLCDVMMPEMDGHEVVRELRSDPQTSLVAFVFLTARSDKGDVRMGMNFGADDYLVKPVGRDDLLAAVRARLERAMVMQERIQDAVATTSGGTYKPDFSSPEPLKRHGLTHREAEVLLWVAQGKSNGDVAAILGMSEKTVKQHMGNVFAKLGVENRNAAAMLAVECLRQPARESGG